MSRPARAALGLAGRALLVIVALTAHGPRAFAAAGPTPATASPIGADTPVTYIGADSVAAGFARGAVLVRQGNYMIHASRRTAPGMVEVHDEDTDLIYVLDGTATFVTGGRVLDGKVTGPGEIRGTELAGGTTRHLVKGDVVVVPNGVCHWFQEVSSPFLYYVVKVR
jgi:mannose-6-phosphate isomerase-like protein (cupin superfamily)